MRRFFVPSERIGLKQTRIYGQDAHHIRQVLRLQPGDDIIVFDGQGVELQAHIIAFDEGGVLIDLADFLINNTESPLNLVLAQGFLKDKKMDTLVRQLTELGVRSWLPFLAERSIPNPDERRRQTRHERWQKITREAVKQCRRGKVMQVAPIMSFEKALDQSEPFDVKIIFWENETHPLSGTIQNTLPHNGVFAMIGPEGGFSEREVNAALDRGFVCVGLGPRILRAETATLAACTLLQYLFGDLGSVPADNHF